MFELRDYQENIIRETRALIQKGRKSILIQSPTGSGKTALTAHMLGVSSSRGIPSWFIVHRRELIMQSARTFDGVGIRYGIIASGFPEDTRPLVQIASIQTLARRLDKVKRPALIVWDECHHVASKSWSTVHAKFSDAIHIGLTATPQRLDGTGLGKWFQVMVQGPSVSELIRQGYLANYRAYAPSKIDVSALHIRMGDYAKEEMIAAVDKPTITGDAVSHYMRLAAGKRALVFAASIQHSNHIVTQFLESGIPAEHIDGDTEAHIRDGAMKRFAAGKTLILSNVDLFGEGLDIPGIEAVVLLRPTASLGLALQQIGRALRPAEGKSHAIILDHVGNLERHGLPDDDREWSLAGREKTKRGKQEKEPSVRVCPKCFACMKSGVTACEYCKHIFPVKSREVTEQEGELVEVDREQLRLERKREQGKASSLDELIAVGKQRKYKNPYMWAKYVLQARNKLARKQTVNIGGKSWGKKQTSQ